MNDYDVVVVGARVAGAATGLLLARAGLRVALVDRGRYGSDTLSTHALMRAGVLQLARWGLLDQVVAAGTPAVRRVTFHYQGLDPLHVSIRPSAGVSALYAPRRHLLDRILVDAAAAAGADVLHGTTVTGLLRDDNGRVRGVRGTGPGTGDLRLRAAVTVGADGIRSVVARETEAPLDRRGHAAGAVLYRHLPSLPAGGYEWAYGASAAAGLIPTNDGRTVFFVSTTPQRMRALRRQGVDTAFRTLVSAAAPAIEDRVAAAGPAPQTHGWGGVAGFVRRSWGPGWALVGDAGYFKDPITAHGMTDALRDAEVLADEILEALAGETPEALALSRYQAIRDRLSSRMFEVTEAVATYDWDVERVQRLLREVSSAMSDEVEFLESRGRDRLDRLLGSASTRT